MSRRKSMKNHFGMELWGNGADDFVWTLIGGAIWTLNQESLVRCTRISEYKLYQYRSAQNAFIWRKSMGTRFGMILWGNADEDLFRNSLHSFRCDTISLKWFASRSCLFESINATPFTSVSMCLPSWHKITQIMLTICEISSQLFRKL